LGISGAWTAKVSARSAITGRNALSCSVEGILGFNVFLSEEKGGNCCGHQETGDSTIPQNSVAGSMGGTFNAQASTPTKQVSGSGGAGWTIGGTYDPAIEAVRIAVRSSGIDAKGTEVVLGKTDQGAAPAPDPFSTRWNWGLPNPRTDKPSTVLDVLKAPVPVVIPSERAADLLMVNALPQTGLTESQHLLIDLCNPKPQTFDQTLQDESGLGTRTTTWTFTLVPLVNIERVDRAKEGCSSFVSSDSPTFQAAIPGVTLAKSGWSNLVSWEVKERSPISGSGTPSQLPHSPRFAFRPQPANRPTGGSTVRNPPLQYTVSATLEGTPQYFILIQDDVDLLRQEYIDHNENVVPSRADCCARPIDGSFNVGNYNWAVDGGMQGALDKVALEFRKDSRPTLRVLSGFRSPQRNKAVGDVRPNNKHVLGRALDLAPEPASHDSLTALYDACIRAGFHTFCESGPGTEVPNGSPDAKHVHIDW